METAPGGVCARCAAPLSGGGDCLACLLGAALYEAAEMIPPPAVVYGDFEITRREDGTLWELGRGGMGVTYRAVDRVLHRAVALKVIETPARSGGAEAVRDRFLREARAAAVLKHANVAGVFQFGASPETGRCYYAMELVEGETLAERVRRDGPLPVAVVLEIAVQVTSALAAAERRGLVHRDLKPGNIMLIREEAPTTVTEVKVIDFGLAKAAVATTGETDLTHGGFVGTPAYASPEQFSRAEVDTRSDLYALGVTMWFALTGRQPFSGKTFDEIQHHPSRAVLPIEQLTAHKTPAPVIALLRKLLALDMADRPASAREFLIALEDCRRLLHERRERPHRMAGRRKPLTIVHLAAILSVVGMLALGGTWWLFSARHRDRLQKPPSFIGIKCVAVLPFADLSLNQENAFFADGVQEEILTDLAKVADLTVISRTSVMPYKRGVKRNLGEITQELGVSHVVEGGVQRMGSRVHVTVQLIDAQTGKELWADAFNGEISDLFSMQSGIAQAVVHQLEAKLSPREKSDIDTPPTTNFAAYESYRHGRKMEREAELTQEDTDMRAAVRQLEEATAGDPRFFLAWCELCRAHLSLYWYNLDRTPERLATAEHALQEIQRLRPDAGEAHLTRGLYLHWGRHDLAGAAAEFQTAARLLPNDPEAPFWLGVALRRQGRWEQSLAETTRATVLDPRNSNLWIQLSERYTDVYRYADAVHASERAMTIDPLNLYYPYWRAECIRMATADLEPLRAWMRAVPTDSDKWSDAAALVAVTVALQSKDYDAAARALTRFRLPTNVDRGYIWPRSEMEGRIAALSGDHAFARMALLTARQNAEEVVKDNPQDAKALMVRAKIDAELGEKERATRDGQRACAMLPASTDALDHSYMDMVMAEIYAQAGEVDQAIEKLGSIVGKPAGPSYGDLRLNRQWDPLRDDLRFGTLMTSVAP